MNLQPLRIEAGWHVSYNQLYEVDPLPGFESYFEGSSLLVLQNHRRLTLMDVQWRPERDLEGEYQVQVLSFVETFNPRTNEFDITPDWEHPLLEFATASRLVLVEKLEELMRSLPVREDPRITSKRGVVAELSESYRLDLQSNGISPSLIEQILENGNAKIQSLVLDHGEMTRSILLEFVQRARTKQVKNKARQKLTSKRFRE